MVRTQVQRVETWRPPRRWEKRQDGTWTWSLMLKILSGFEKESAAKEQMIWRYEEDSSVVNKRYVCQCICKTSQVTGSFSWKISSLISVYNLLITTKLVVHVKEMNLLVIKKVLYTDLKIPVANFLPLQLQYEWVTNEISCGFSEINGLNQLWFGPFCLMCYFFFH